MSQHRIEWVRERDTVAASFVAESGRLPCWNTSVVLFARHAAQESRCSHDRP
jgi:hypothetical protein